MKQKYSATNRRLLITGYCREKNSLSFAASSSSACSASSNGFFSSFMPGAGASLSREIYIVGSYVLRGMLTLYSMFFSFVASSAMSVSAVCKNFGYQRYRNKNESSPRGMSMIFHSLPGDLDDVTLLGLI